MSAPEFRPEDAEVVETVARAIWAADNPETEDITIAWDDYPREHEDYRRMGGEVVTRLRAALRDDTGDGR